MPAGWLMKLRLAPVIAAGVMAVCEVAGCGSSGAPRAPEAKQGTEAGDSDSDDAIDPSSLVTATLLADSTHVAPGGEHWVAVELQVADGWHVYWENPGDSGLETSVAFQVPAGFAVGDVRYPGPRRFGSAPDGVSYGYEGRIALLARVTAPAAIPDPEVRIGARASWVACRSDACVPGQRELELQWPRATDAAAAAPANRERLAPSLAALPRPWSELGGEATWTEGAGGRPRLRVTVPGAVDLELFPDRSLPIGASIEPVALDDGRGFDVALPDEPPVDAVRGVVRVRRGDATSDDYYQLTVAVPATP